MNLSITDRKILHSMSTTKMSERIKIALTKLKKIKPKIPMKNILVTTQHRGVFFAQVEESTDLTPKMLTNLKNCRMAIYFGTKRGILELAEDGPNANSKIGAKADVDVLHDVTGVFSVSDKAAEKWLA